MKRILSAVLLAVVLAPPAFAAKVYLKDGGVIEAKRVWRSGAKVHVLATRHTLTTFEKGEVDLKRTFVNKRRAAKKVAAVAPQAEKSAAAPGRAVATSKNAEKKPAESKPVEKKARVSLPALPKLPEKSPENLVPASGGGGTIKQHKKEMAEKVAE